MLKKTILLVGVLALAGCVTASERFEDGPSVVKLSDKQPSVIADCVARKSPQSVTVTPTPDGGVRVSSNKNPNMANFVEIAPVGQGSELRFYTQRGLRVAFDSCI